METIDKNSRVLYWKEDFYFRLQAECVKYWNLETPNI